MAAVYATQTVVFVMGTPSNQQSRHGLSGPTDRMNHRGGRGGGGCEGTAPILLVVLPSFPSKLT